MTVNKKDLLIILLLCVVFLSIALPNLGYTQQFTTAVELKTGNSFYLDLGSVVDVKSLVLVLIDGPYNVTVSSGSPGNWNSSINALGQYVSPGIQSWQEINVDQPTQYIKVDFGDTWQLTAKVSEVAVIGQGDEVVAVNSITNAGEGNPQLQNLIDEQSQIHYPFDTYNLIFDEAYYVPSANQYLHGQVSSENVNPPLGKLLMAASVAVFGLTPFGWRIGDVIFATLAIALVYLLGKELTESWVGGFAAAFLFTFDFMHFTLARLGMLDSFLIFFSLASQLFFFVYLKNVLKSGWKTSIVPLVLWIVFFGLGFSTKWNVLFAFLGEIAILLALRVIGILKVKETITAKLRAFVAYPFFYAVIFLLVAVGIYFASFIPEMLAGRSFGDVVNLQFSMWHYQQSLAGPSSQFTSPWFSWPLMFDFSNGGTHVPIVLLAAQHPNGSISSMVLFGNPAVWWIGFAAMVGLMVFLISKLFTRKFSLKAHLLPLSIVVIFLCQWMTFILTSRYTFVYHFYVSVPFLCFASAFFISRYWQNKWVKASAIIYFALVIAVFMLFYPVISGTPTTESTLNNLNWISSWGFI